MTNNDYIDGDQCIKAALKGALVHLKDDLYFLTAETALKQKIIPENICRTAPFWIIGYETPKPIQNNEELESSFGWHNFFAKFSDHADECKDFNLRGD